MSFSFNLGGSSSSSSQEQNSTSSSVSNQEQNQASTSASQTVQQQEQQNIQNAIQNILQQVQQQQQQNQQTTGTAASTGAQNQEQNQQQQVTTTSLNANVQESLSERILSLLGNSQSGNSSALLELLSGQALTAGQDINTANNQILENARFSGERNLRALQTQLAQQSGGSLANTGVTAGTAEATVNLESQLGALAGNLNLQGRQQSAQEITNALSATQVNTNELSTLLQALSGATTVQQGNVQRTVNSTQQQNQQTQQQSLSDLISSAVTQSAQQNQSTSLSNLLSSATTEQQAQLTNLIEQITNSQSQTNTTGSASGIEAGIGFTGGGS